MSGEKYSIVMLRHGNSVWTENNLFCGWYDSNLSERGLQEAKEAGKTLNEFNYKFDLAYTSELTRAQRTLHTILEDIGQSNIPVRTSWRLNERHYGGFTGLNKAETAAKYGEKQVQIWRRSFDVPPPPISEESPYYKMILENAMSYANGPNLEEIPKFESLKLTMSRAIPYWEDIIVPQIRDGKRILIVAHGSSLRGIVKHLEQISDKDIMDLNLPTGIPFVYSLNEDMKASEPLKFLADEESVKSAIAYVVNQGKAINNSKQNSKSKHIN